MFLELVLLWLVQLMRSVRGLPLLHADCFIGIGFHCLCAHQIIFTYRYILVIFTYRYVLVIFTYRYILVQITMAVVQLKQLNKLKQEDGSCSTLATRGNGGNWT